MGTAPTVLQPLKSGSLSSRVFETLRTAIFAGELQPGDPLRELHLATDLRVSQATVREALARLEQFGLVVRTPNIGTHVTRLSQQDIRERTQLRALLEEHAMLQAAPRMTDEAFADLRSRLDDLADAIERNAYFQQAQADLSFHRYIWLMSGNRTLYRTLDQLAVPLFAFVSMLRRAGHQSLKDVVQSHEGLVASLRSKSPAEIRDAVRQHFAHGLALPASNTLDADADTVDPIA
jgi:DNA-binding GntR family transcriptional regulator